MKRSLILLGMLGLVACDKQLSVTPSGPPVITEKSVNCIYSGVCYTCVPGVGFDGKMGMKCGMKLSSMCGGSQLARVQTTPLEIVYESGKKVISSRDLVLERLGECE